VLAPGDYNDGEIGGMMIGSGNRSIRRKSTPEPLCPPQTPHAARTRTRAAAVGSQRLTASATVRRPCVPLKPGIDCARLPREAMFVALPRKVDTMLPRANLGHVEANRSGSLSRGKVISVCCALYVETVSWRRSTSARGCRASTLDTNTDIDA
jgi:hypothetical protein